MTADKEKPGCGTQIVTIIGLSFVLAFIKSVGMALLFPGLFTISAAWATKRLLRPAEQVFLPAAALIGGLIFSLCLGVTLTFSQQSESPDLLGTVLICGLELVGLATGLIWLFIRPWLRPILFLGFVLAIDLGFSSYALSQTESNSAAENPQLVGWWMRVGAMICLVVGFIIRRRETAIRAGSGETNDGSAV